jgi:hypothetical protein
LANFSELQLHDRCFANRLSSGEPHTQASPEVCRAILDGTMCLWSAALNNLLYMPTRARSFRAQHRGVDIARRVPDGASLVVVDVGVPVPLERTLVGELEFEASQPWGLGVVVNDPTRLAGLCIDAIGHHFKEAKGFTRGRTNGKRNVISGPVPRTYPALRSELADRLGYLNTATTPRSAAAFVAMAVEVANNALGLVSGTDIFPATRFVPTLQTKEEYLASAQKALPWPRLHPVPEGGTR